MRNLYVALATATGLLLAFAASAEAGGGRSVGGPGGPNFQPPGWSNAPWFNTNKGLNNNSGITTQPPGWSNNSTGQLSADWLHTSPTGTGGLPKGLGTH